MKEILQDGGRLFLRTIVVNLMCLFVVVSIYNFAAAMLSREVGYVAYGTQDTEKEGEKLYTYYEVDGEDTKLAEYEAKGYTVTKRTIREVGKTADIITEIVAQIFAMGILVAFVYPKMWDQGYRDRNLVKTKHKREDALKGLKVGLLGATPNIIAFVFLAVTKNGVSKGLSLWLYKIANASVYTLSEVIAGQALKFGDLSALQLVIMGLTLLIMPAIAFAGYYLGYRGFSIGEKLTYKGTK